MNTGVLVQADNSTKPGYLVDFLREALAAHEKRHGWRPSVIQVHAGVKWPADVDGVRLEPTPLMPYPTHFLFINPVIGQPSLFLEPVVSDGSNTE